MKKVISVVMAAVLAVGMLLPANAMTDESCVSASITSAKMASDSAGFTRDFSINGKIRNTTKFTAEINKVIVNADVKDPAYKETFEITPDNPGTSYTLINGSQYQCVVPKSVKPGKAVEYQTAIKTNLTGDMEEALSSSAYADTKVEVEFTLTAKTKKAVKLLKKANAKAKSLKKLKKNLKVTVVSPKASKGFIKITAAGKTGFVKSNVLKAA